MKRVHFIGSGYESVKFIYVEAETNGEAFEKAKEWYKATGQTFDYLEMEISHYSFWFKVDLPTTNGEL